MSPAEASRFCQLVNRARKTLTSWPNACAAPRPKPTTASPPLANLPKGPKWLNPNRGYASHRLVLPLSRREEDQGTRRLGERRPPTRSRHVGDVIDSLSRHISGARPPTGSGPPPPSLALRRGAYGQLEATSPPAVLPPYMRNSLRSALLPSFLTLMPSCDWFFPGLLVFLLLCVMLWIVICDAKMNRGRQHTWWLVTEEETVNFRTGGDMVYGFWNFRNF
jgi:hypothetical protein